MLDSMAVFLTSKHDGKEGIESFLEKRPAKFTNSPNESDIQGLLNKIRGAAKL